MITKYDFLCVVKLGKVENLVEYVDVQLLMEINLTFKENKDLEIICDRVHDNILECHVC